MTTVVAQQAFPKFCYYYNGTPLVGGCVHTYVAGTTTPQTTYSESTGTTTNANPVVLDANGEASIWLIASSTYKFIIKDSTDTTTLDTIDNISPNITSGTFSLAGNLQISNFSITDSNSNNYMKFTTTTSAVNYFMVTNSVSNAGVTFGVGGTDSNIDIILNCKAAAKVQLGSSTSTGTVLLGDQSFQDSSKNNYLSFVKTATAVNYWQLTNNATGSGPIFKAVGSDTNVSGTIGTQGTGTLFLGSTTSAGNQLLGNQPFLDSNGKSLLAFISTASAVNGFTITNAATGTNPTISATGSDSNIGINYNTKGTGNHIFNSAINETAVTLASGSTVNIGAANGNYITITGTTTITAFDTVAAGVKRTLKFSGILTLTYNATSMILLTAANITTAVGDTSVFVSEGGGNWRQLEYSRASGAALAGAVAGSTTQVQYNNAGAAAGSVNLTFDGANLTCGGAVKWARGSDVPSATTTPIGAASGNGVNITGTTTITGFDTGAGIGTIKFVTFTGALILTNNATSLILPTNSNITTANGDTATFECINSISGYWKCLQYQKANGQALATPSASNSSNYPAGGRLTLSSTLPVSTADITAATTVYYLPYISDLVATYDGTNWTNRSIPAAGLSISLSGFVASTPYDVCASWNGTSLILSTFIWASATARSTALTVQNGVYTIVSGGVYYRYLGTILITGSTGQCEDSAAKRYVWNYYNRVKKQAAVAYGGTSWTYNSTTWRQANASAVNQLQFVVGVVEDTVQVSIVGQCANSSLCYVATGLGNNNTSVNSSLSTGTTIPASGGTLTQIDAQYNGFPSTIGYNFLAGLEQAAALGTTTWYATNTNSGLTATAAIQGQIQC